MFRLSRRSVASSFVRELVAFSLSFFLIATPLFSLRTAKAETPKKSASKPARVQNNHARKDGQLIVKFRQGASDEQRAFVLNAFAKDHKPMRGNSNTSKLKLKDGMDVDNAASNARQFDAIVEFAEPDYIVTGLKTAIQVLPTPNDPGFPSQWALSNVGQNGGFAGADINARAGWQATTGANGTIIAVIDTGVDVNHADLSRNLWVNKAEANGRNNDDDDRNGFVDDVQGWNFVNDTKNVNDDHGHGTAMAGIIAAEGNNHLGISGVMWKASILPLKALDSTGSGAISDVVEAMDYAVVRGASVINCSFGTSGFSQALLDAINRASVAGVLVVASAGNSAQDLTNSPYYPASYTANNLITVAATTNSDLLAPFSNWGTSSVHIAAPGVDVLTTTPNGKYGTISGTSAAAPLVAGAAGLLKTRRSWVSAQSVRKSLIDSARKVAALTGRVASGGILSTGEAITLFESLTNSGNNGNGNGNGNGSGNRNGNGNGGGQPTSGQLDFMRANRPNLPEPRVTVNNLPPPGYDDPGSGSGSSANAYYTEQTKAKNATGVASRLAKAQPDPTDDDGGGGVPQASVNLGSQNFSFTAPVLSLNGRAGLGVGLAMTYNSKVWNLDSANSKMFFNADKGYPGPGWRLGFGVIQGKNINNTSGPNGAIGPYTNSVSGKNSYIYISSDGSRHDLAYNSTTTLYESYDSSYMDFNESTKVLRMMNGTRITFGTSYDYQFLPTEIKDRNGNKITITNAAIVNGDGVGSNNDVTIDYVTDTMGRKIDFYYESNRLVRIRQLRNSDSANPANWGSYPKSNAAWFNYAIIDYAAVTVSTNFSGLTLDPSTINNSTIYLPSSVTYPTGNNYRFYYTSYAQMWAIEKWVPTVVGQGTERSVAYTTYALPSINGVSYPSRSGAMSDSTAKGDCPAFTGRTEQAESWNGGTAVSYSYNVTNPSDSTVTDPAGRIYRSQSGTLSQTTTIYADAAAYTAGTYLKRFTTTYEDDGLSYQSNVRPTEIKIEDSSNTRKTGISYTAGSVKLPTDVTEYQGSTTTVYRHTVTTYNTNTAYSNLHIYGLPDQVCLYSGSGTTTLISKTAYAYDDAGYFWASGGDNVIQHDLTNYGDSFITGRANLSKVTQYSVVSGTASSPRDVSRTKHDTQGNVRQTLDVSGHTVTFNVWDNLANKPSVGETHAMVSDVTDPDGYKNGGQYNWYNGLPAQNYHLKASNGAQENNVTYGYDTADRVTAVNRPDGGVTTRSYWDNWLAVAEYIKIDATQTRYSFIAFDGSGNTRWTGGDHPDGASGKYSIQKYVYDNLGRTSQVSNTTAIDGNYNPIDDDVTLGYLYTTTTYDKLDRPTVVTRPDNNTVQISYTGCGCAGGQTVTVTDERSKKRKQVYDYYGRLAEAHELDGSSNTYSKAVYSYDVRDLLQTIAQYNGGTAHQDRTFVYDGYARLSSQTTPEEGTVSYTYYSDDLINTVQNQKATGNTATFTYNNRHQLTGISYNDSGATPSVSYGAYDEYGARTSMTTTGIGSTTYSYNTYHQLSSETISLTGYGSATLSYQYNYAGAPTKATYTVGAWVKNVNYAYNYAGALTGTGTDLISGGSSTNTTNVINTLNYRGFGGIKSLNFGSNPRLMQISYDAKRQQMTNMFIRRTSNTGADNVIVNSDYDYYNGGANNGRIQKITDNTDAAYTTTYGYDAYNRLTSATATAFTRSYSYDNWGNLTGVTSTGAGETGTYTLSYVTNASGAPSTNRINNAGFSYDNAGNQTAGDGWTYAYDAANRLKSAGASGNTYGYDGDGHKVKQDTGGYGNLYYIWSSVLGQPVVEATTGGVYRAYVYGPSGQSLGLLSYDSQFYWVHSDHLGSGRKLTDVNGNVTYRGEFDPHGQTMLEVAPGGTYLNSKKFTGYERNWATNLDDANARTYHHNRNRFMQPDPLGVGAADTTNSQSFNRYSYVGNDPVNFVDPSGMYIQSWLECDRKVTSTDLDGNISTTTYCTLHIVIYDSGGGSIGGGWGSDIFTGGGGGGGNSAGTTPDKKLDLEKFVPCFIDALVNAGIGLVPGGGVAQAALNYFGISLNPAQWLMGQSSFFGGQADLIDSAKAVSSVAKDVAEVSYSSAGGNVALKRAEDLVARKSFETASQAQQMKRLATLDKLTKLGKTAKALPAIAQAMAVIGLIKDTKLCYDKSLK